MLNLLARIPLAVLYPFATLLAWLLERVVGYRRGVVEANLKAAFPEADTVQLRAFGHQVYRNIADSFIETLKALAIRRSDLEARVQFENPEVLSPYLEAGQPVMIVGGHQANWEWIFLRLGLTLDCPLEGVYRPQRSAYFDRLLKRIRTRFGAGVIPYQEAFRHIVAHRNSARVFTFIVDQRPSDQEERYWANFLNQDTAFYLGWAKLAQLTRFPVFYADQRRTARGHYVVTLKLLSVEPPASKGDGLVEAFVRALEASIRETPGDWLWSHRRWRDKRPIYE